MGKCIFFHLWTEDQGTRGPEEVGSSILAYLEIMKINNIAFDNLIAWSDSAGGQNKNFFIVCLWHYLINTGVFKKIDHKFPVVGHTFMDSDRDFAAVEKAIRKQQNIYTVDQYIMSIMTEARKKTPFNITRMADKFIDIKELPRKLGLIDRKKNEKNEKVLFRDIRWIQIEEFGKTKYRYSFDEAEEWNTVDIKKSRKIDRNQENDSILVTIDKSRAIAAKKFDNIQEQIPFIPENFRRFYHNLKREEI